MSLAAGIPWSDGGPKTLVSSSRLIIGFPAASEYFAFPDINFAVAMLQVSSAANHVSVRALSVGSPPDSCK